MSTQDTSSSTTSTASSAATPAGTRRGVALGVAGGLLAGTAAGLVLGVPGLTSAASNDVVASPAAVVQQADDGSDPADDPGAAVGSKLRETLQALVDDGTITAEQADEVTAHLVENRPERGERGDRAGRGVPGGFGRGVASEALTDLLGLDTTELRQQLRDGSTLAEIAETQAVDVQDVVDELVNELDERLTNAVDNGRIDQAEADEQLADAEARITDRVINGRD